MSITATTLPWATPSSACTSTSVSGFSARAFSRIFFSASSSTTLPCTTTRPSERMAMARSWTSFTALAWPPLGRLTLMPPFCPPASAMAVVVTMKMMSRTRKMSVSGVMLMSAKMPRAGPGPALVARACSSTCQDSSAAAGRAPARTSFTISRNSSVRSLSWSCSRPARTLSML